MNRWRPLRPIRTEEHDPETNKLVVKIDVERRSREELEAMSLDIPDTTMGRAHKKQQEEVQPKVNLKRRAQITKLQERLTTLELTDSEAKRKARYLRHILKTLQVFTYNFNTKLKIQTNIFFIIC